MNQSHKHLLINASRNSEARLTQAYYMDSVKEDIVYFPFGDHTLSPSVDGEAVTISISINDDNGRDLAKTLQLQLQDRLDQNVRPNIDFDHENKKSAAIPKRFFYREGVGVMLELEWTNSGRQAIEGRDYTYFSPSFLMRDDSTLPTGIPELGPIGALTNDPAFRVMPKISAHNSAPNKTNTMNQLVTSGLLTEVEAANSDAVTLAQRRVANMREAANKTSQVEAQLKAANEAKTKLEETVKTLKAEAQKAREDAAERAVTAAVSAGRIPAKDEATQAFWKSTILTQGATAEAQLAKMPVIAEVGGAVITASNSGENHLDGTEWGKLVAAHKAQGKDEGQAITAAAAERPDLYDKQFGYSQD